MQKIVPHLWFDTQAKQAAEFYVSIFPNSKVTHCSVLKNTPSGDCDMLAYSLSGYEFMAISAGPMFKINPSISFLVNFNPTQDPTPETNLRKLWDALIEGGKALMPLQEYPFSKLYGWVEDKFGVSWQLIVTNPEREPRSFIQPSMMFTGPAAGKAEEAGEFYRAIFKGSKEGVLARYPEDNEYDKAGTVMYSDFTLEDQWFAAMDSGYPHGFNFGGGLSFLVNCDDQAEIDFFWEKLSAVPQAEQCGWLVDKFGVAWQITPRAMGKMMSEGTPEQIARVTAAFMQMKKFDLAALEAAYAGN